MQNVSLKDTVSLKSIKSLKTVLGIGLTALMGAIILVALTCTAAPAATADYGRLLSIYPVAPSRTAVDDNGTLYVLSMANDNITTYDHLGNPGETIRVKDALSLAVGQDGLIYIASEKGKLYVLMDGKPRLFSKKLGYPIAMDYGAGALYVLDSSDSSVKVLNRDGSVSYSFGGRGVKDGMLNHPFAVAVNAGYVYVLDRGAELTITTDYGGTVEVPRVQVFDIKGTFIRSFGVLGIDDGFLMNPVSLDADEDGNIYIADLAEQVVQVFDTMGVHQYTVYDLAFPFQSPNNVYFRNGKLYIISSLTRRIDVYYIGDDYTVLNASPSEGVALAAQPCAGATQGQLTLDNSGPGAAQWQAVASEPWLMLESDSGVVPGNSSAIVGLSAIANGLSPGTHEAKVTITATGARLEVPVSLEVMNPATLWATPDALSFTVKITDVPPATLVEVGLVNDLSDGLAWSASADSAWIDLLPPGGVSNSITLMSVGISESALSTMGGGEHSGAITISAGCDSIPDVKVSVDLLLVKYSSIVVKTNMQEARYLIKGPVTYEGFGEISVFDDVPEGTYAITYAPIDGYLTPASYSLTVTYGQMVSFEDDYLDLRTSQRILACRAETDGSGNDIVNVHDMSGAMLASITVPDPNQGLTPLSAFISGTLQCELGDVDADGIEDIVIRNSDGMVSGYHLDGQPIEGLAFLPFAQYADIELSLADLNGDGRDEIVLGAAAYSELGPLVSVLRYQDGGIIDTGMRFMAHDDSSGVRLATGDIDGDGIDEIVTAAGGDGSREVQARIWKADTVGGEWAWSALEAGTIQAGIGYAGPVIALGDINADSAAEVMLMIQSKRRGGLVVKAFRGNGLSVVDFWVPGSTAGSMAAGDLDYDGMAEIAIMNMSRTDDKAVTSVYEPDGTLSGSFVAFESIDAAQGATICIGSPGL